MADDEGGITDEDFLTHLGKMHYKSTKSTFCNTSTRRSFSYPSDPSYPSYLLRVAVAHKVANQLAQVHSQLTHMRHYDDRNGSKTRGWLRQHIIGSK
jgi:hypothetical protein